MKRFFSALVCLGLAFWAAYSIGRAQSNRAERAFSPTPFPGINRSFVVVVVGRNNGAFLDKTLGSVLGQNYENYRMVYVDDGSNDGSLELARDLIFEHDRKADIISNEAPLGVLACLSNAVRECKDDEIVVVLGGEDWLAHEWVLTRLNQYYANSDLWITYGQSCEYPQYTVQEVKKPGREKAFSNLRLCSFYAGLFKQIGEGEFADLHSDVEMAYMLPMLEMAESHSTFVPEVLYVLNASVPKEELAQSEKMIREMASYEPIHRWGGE